MRITIQVIYLLFEFTLYYLLENIKKGSAQRADPLSIYYTYRIICLEQFYL